MCQPEIYWLSKQRFLSFRGWQNLNMKRLVCGQWVSLWWKYSRLFVEKLTSVWTFSFWYNLAAYLQLSAAKQEHIWHVLKPGTRTQVVLVLNLVLVVQSKAPYYFCYSLTALGNFQLRRKSAAVCLVGLFTVLQCTNNLSGLETCLAFSSSFL